MSVYPASPIPSEGVEWSEEFMTAIAGPYPSGKTVGTALRNYPLWKAKFFHRYVTPSEVGTVQDFFRSQKGKAGRFTFKDWNPLPWTRVYVATGASGTTAFDLPFVSTTGLVLRKGATTLTLTTDYSISLGAGADGRDRVTLVAAPDGYLLEADATAKRTIYGRLTADALPALEGEAGNWSIGTIEILEAT